MTDRSLSQVFEKCLLRVLKKVTATLSILEKYKNFFFLLILRNGKATDSKIFETLRYQYG